MINFKIEHSKCQKGAVSPIGVMVEITAPTAPVVENVQPRAAKALVFVVDRSGSMEGARLDAARSAIMDTIPRLNEADWISVVAFDHDATLVVPMQMVRGANRAAIVDQVRALRSGGNTNVEAGFNLAVDQAKRAPRGVEANIILLSDGQANAGRHRPEELGQLAASAIEHFVTTTTIGIGAGYDETVLDAMATSGQGNHVAAYEQAEVIGALQSEIDNLLLKTITDVRFEITLAPQLAGPRSFIQPARQMRRFRREGGVARAVLGDLSSGEERNVVFEIGTDVHPMTDPGKFVGLLVAVSYRNELTGEEIREVKEFEFEVVDAANWVEPARDGDIVAELAELRLQRVRDRAFELYREGKEAEADAMLRDAGLQLQQLLDELQLSERSQSRLHSKRDEFSSFIQMSNINEKRKRLAEDRNRAARDRKNFRDSN